MTDETPVQPELEPEEGTKEKGILLLFRFVLVPLIVVGVVVFVIVLFGNIALKEKSVRDYLYDIRSGSKSERWQAAYHLSNLLANPKKNYEDEARKNLPEILEIYKRARGTDPEIRRYLALALGRLKDSRALPALQDSINDEDSQTVIWSIWALGAIGDRTAVPALIDKMESQDEAFRVMSAYALGVIGDEKAIPSLQAHLDDSSAEVSWNSAIALARMNNASGAGILMKMLDRDYLAGFPNMSESSKQELLVNAIKASDRLNDPGLNDLIVKLSKSDPNLTVRDTAIKALQ